MSQSELDALLTCQLFDGVTAADLAVLGVRPHRRRFAAGEVIFDREDTSRDVYFLLGGRVLAVFWTMDGREINFGRIGVGSYFGEMAAIDNEERSLSIYAQRVSEVLILKQADFLRVLDDVPVARQRLLVDLVKRVRLMNERSYQSAALSVEQRVRAYLVRLGLEVGALVNGGEIRDAPTHLEIANTVGSNREAVSRVMGELKREGVIDTGRQRISFRQPNVLLERTV